MKIIFRCEASLDIGIGHVMRCMALADKLAQLGAEIYFWTSPETLKSVSILSKKSYKIINVNNGIEHIKAEILVVDNYELNDSFESQWRDHVKKIIVIDDLANRAHDCDLLIDQTYGRSDSDYKSLVPKHAKILTGHDYTILRTEFTQHREKSLQTRIANNGQIKKIFINFGGGDPNNVTGAILKIFEKINYTSLDIVIVLGTQAPFVDDVQKTASNIPNHNIQILKSVDNIAEIMASCDLAIGAGGISTWERCCLGLPTILIVLADNQNLIAKNLHDVGAVINVGEYSKKTREIVKDCLNNLINNPKKVKDINHYAFKISDGSGINRIISEVFEK